MSCRHMEGLDHSIFNLFPNEVTINLYMLGSFMEYRICNNIECCLAITIERSWFFVCMTKSINLYILILLKILKLPAASYISMTSRILLRRCKNQRLTFWCQYKQPNLHHSNTSASVQIVQIGKDLVLVSSSSTSISCRLLEDVAF